VRCRAQTVCDGARAIAICDLSWIGPLDSSCHWHQSSWSLPHKVSETAAADQLATVHPKQRGRSDYWLAVDLGSHPPTSQRPLRSRRETTTRRPGAQGHPLPRWPVTPTCLLVDHPMTSGNAARVDPKRDGSTRSGRTTESPLPNLWRRATSRGHRGATLRPPAGYAITTTTTKSHLGRLNLW